MKNTDNLLSENEIISLGKSLIKIENKLLKKSQNEGKIRIWFQGEEPYFDVFFEFEDDEISWFQLTLRGQSLSWDKKFSGFQTGTTNELSIDDASFYAASKTIENDNQLDWNFIYLVKSIMQIQAEEPAFAKALNLFDKNLND
ncbi:conserved hypothetical protein [Trichormus variabilis ATCC 29413]|uniref:Uncharacterized protein n=2 Tax=Anabaena variabilis TaxID=264691 RepID=Q3M7N9_TRIV2|nr:MULTISPECIES: hypothetical protein [Nostocaceae]ABA22997.1 conserved hypothetical protein [Trichormus variabilis ATCC 29413]MBC1217578.1 hypothetical protein [Trichormus variabilis ARAD]MBC1268546.1 hypothetical protein [Trichormus variabilis FSR]MBC1302632.1 hypothetical protein [Trichormus variabilis N2B]MBC1312122.1 hypothetical protein [Trichormus variabilis PNB]